MIRGGKSFVSSPPAFSNDAKKLLVCTGDTVSIFSTATGLQISELEGHTALVTSVIVVPAPTPASRILCYCWTTSLDGTIKYWDFSVPELMKTINIQLPIYSMVIPSLLSQRSENDVKSPDIYAYVSVEDTKNEQNKQRKELSGQILKCNLSKSRLVRGVILTESKKPENITISSTGKYFGIHEKCQLRIWEVPAKDLKNITHRKLKLSHTKNLSCLAFHPTERIVAAGDVTGRILIWRGFGGKTFAGDNSANGRLLMDEDDKPGVRGDGDADSCTTWHWHSAEVKVLFFSSDGAYLYSGGKEGVLVVWQLDTGKKKFLPRIGTRLLHFLNSPDPSLSSISCADNRIHILKTPSMEILKSISGIKLPSPVPETFRDLCNDFVFDHTAGLVAVRTENYCIQFYSLFDDREISEVQVCERNHQPSDDVTIILNLVALSFEGSVMCTVETRMAEEGIGGFITLKFWECGSQNSDFSLSTVIYEPHREAAVSAIAFHPTRGMAVSASYGGDFKVWVGNCESQQNDKLIQRTRWACHAVGSYRKKPMTAAAFSSDGSVLAVAAETVITLWDPEKNVLVAVIGSALESIVNLSFIGESNFLVSASHGSRPQLAVWSMSKLSISWSYKLQTEAVACSQKDSLLAVLAVLPESYKGQEHDKTTLHNANGVILLFNAGDPIPIASWFVTKAKGGGLAFIQSRSSGDNMDENDLLAYVNGDHEYAVFNPHGAEMYERKVRHKDSISGEEGTGNFGYASMYGKLPLTELKLKAIEASSVMPSERAWESIFSGPSHSLPPLTKLCSTFLESFMEKRSVTMVE
ncbi:WD repeat-containing protein 75 [Cynara cardunculus var. scolymus]|uniref:WD repeat-containing protein 75 n=1 Tax=Cynara cardunculus var. scolymus TaxID=59895 RepID=UPI000D631461|nr:WD repeat-containing protein 75 [Cynara cardunculus var. scolymus]XP_024959968.1 WD repeat-containing protein 75 [Cynara cardunculus var. scolymus]